MAKGLQKVMLQQQPDDGQQARPRPQDLIRCALHHSAGDPGGLGKPVLCVGYKMT